jgi:hypothetical protein
MHVFLGATSRTLAEARCLDIVPQAPANQIGTTYQGPWPSAAAKNICFSGVIVDRLGTSQRVV